jgi:hypothetical protein
MMEPVPLGFAGPLLEWAPQFIVTQDAFETVVSWGIKVDCLIATSRFSEEHATTLACYDPLEILTAEEPAGWLEVGLEFLVRKGQDAVNILCQQPARWVGFDRYPVAVNVLSTDQMWTLMKNCQYRKWLLSGTCVRIKVQPGQTVRAAGLEALVEAMLVRESGMVSIESDRPFWVCQDLPEARGHV